jgi:hypothetical protein
MFQPIVVDNLFDDPDKVRGFALKQDYYSCKNHPLGESAGNWPGKRSDYVSAIDFTFFKFISKHLYKELNLQEEQNSYIECFFQYCSEFDGNSWVHRDVLNYEPTHVGLIYLTPEPPENSGTILYEHKDPNYVKGGPMDDSGDVSDYNVKQVLENKYNRLVIYHPDEFHKSDTYFGTTKEDSRLFIVFFMRVN